MKRFLAVALLCLLPLSLYAQQSATITVTVTTTHAVTLAWVASTSPNVTGYRVYRGSVTGGPYTLITSNLVASPWADTNVQSGQTYFYVVTAVNSSNQESTYSNEAKAVIP